MGDLARGEPAEQRVKTARPSPLFLFFFFFSPEMTTRRAPTGRIILLNTFNIRNTRVKAYYKDVSTPLNALIGAKQLKLLCADGRERAQ